MHLWNAGERNARCGMLSLGANLGLCIRSLLCNKVSNHSPPFADTIDYKLNTELINSWLLISDDDGLIINQNCCVRGCCLILAALQRWGLYKQKGDFMNFFLCTASEQQCAAFLAQILGRTKGGNNRLISLHCFSTGKRRRQAVLPAEEDIEKTIQKSRQPNPLQGL